MRLRATAGRGARPTAWCSGIVLRGTNSFPGFVVHVYRSVWSVHDSTCFRPPHRVSKSAFTACVQTFPRSHRKLRNRQSSVM